MPVASAQELCQFFEGTLRVAVNLLNVADPYEAIGVCEAAFGVGDEPPSLASGVGSATGVLYFICYIHADGPEQFARTSAVSPTRLSGSPCLPGVFHLSPFRIVSSTRVGVEFNPGYGILANRRQKKMERVVLQTKSLCEREGIPLSTNIVEGWNPYSMDFGFGYQRLLYEWPQANVPGALPVPD